MPVAAAAAPAPGLVSESLTPPWRRAGRGSLFVIVSIIRQVKATKAFPEIGGEIDLTKGDIVEPADFARIMDDPQVRAVAAVNIVQIEQRVRASLGIV